MQVVNCRKEKFDVYIGRPSIFGNPFKIGRDGTREDVIRKYEEYARLNLLSEIAKLPANSVLGCYCKPLACHGDIIIKLYHEKKGGKL